jgi:hypothetical protein
MEIEEMKSEQRQVSLFFTNAQLPSRRSSQTDVFENSQ